MSAPYFVAGAELEKIAPRVKRAPRLEPTPDALVHMRRAAHSRESQGTVRQASRRGEGARRQAVAQAIVSRIQPARWSVKQLSDHTGEPVHEVERLLAEWQDAGLIERPTPRHIETADALMARLVGKAQ